MTYFKLQNIHNILFVIVFRVFDTDADNHISFEEYIRGMTVFLKGKLDERLKCIKET